MKFSIAVLLINLLVSAAFAQEEAEDPAKPLMISKDFYSLTVTQDNKPVEILRNQDRSNLIDEYYRTTGKGKITPMHPFGSEPVETIGELEVLALLKQKKADASTALLVDARVSAGFFRGTIPGSVNISFREIGKKDLLPNILKNQFGVKDKDGQWDFSNAKTLAMFCNGGWCRQSITAIKRLLRIGYPAEKLKYYRGGMQAWHSFGLTVVVPERPAKEKL